MNAAGAILMLAAVWLGFQVIGGDALQRLRVIT